MEHGEFQIREMTRPDQLQALRLSTQSGWNQNANDWQRIYDLCDDSCFAGKIDIQLVATGSLVPYENNCCWIFIRTQRARRDRLLFAIRMACWGLGARGSAEPGHKLVLSLPPRRILPRRL